MIIGICGKSGSGKGTVCAFFKGIGDNIIHVDIDKIGHKVNELEVVKQKLLMTFGPNVLKDGKIDRKYLGKRAFSSNKNMELLTDITWHYMEEQIDFIINENKEKVILLDWNLLPKTKYFEDADLRILVDSPLEERLKRTMKRDSITEKQFMLRESNAPNYEDLNFDIVINNKYKILTRKKVRNIYDKSVISG